MHCIAMTMLCSSEKADMLDRRSPKYECTCMKSWRTSMCSQDTITEANLARPVKFPGDSNREGGWLILPDLTTWSHPRPANPLISQPDTWLLPEYQPLTISPHPAELKLLWIFISLGWFLGFNLGPKTWYPGVPPPFNSLLPFYSRASPIHGGFPQRRFFGVGTCSRLLGTAWSAHIFVLGLV